MTYCMNGGCPKMAWVSVPNTYCDDCREKFNPSTPRLSVQINPPLEVGERYLIPFKGSVWPATYHENEGFHFDGQCSQAWTTSRAWVRLSDVLEAFEEVAP